MQKEGARISIARLAAAMMLVFLLATSAFAFGATPEAIPPTQGSAVTIVPIVSDVKILAGNKGAALVTFRVSAELSPGVSVVGPIEADSGMLPHTLQIVPASEGFSMESVSIEYAGGDAYAYSWRVLSENGGDCAFQVIYMTDSIYWSVSGQLSADRAMLMDGRFYLGIRNESQVGYNSAEIILVGTGGTIQSAKDSIAGVELWKIIKQAGQSIDLTPDSEIRLLLAELKGSPYRTYVGGSVGSGLKGYLGKPAVKEQIRMDVYAEVATSASIDALPSKSFSMAVYQKETDNSFIGANSIGPAEANVAGGLLSVKLGQSAEITAEIERTESRSVGTSSFEESFRITIRSSSSFPTEVQLIESFPGEWTMISNTGAEWVRKDGNTAVAKFTVPAKGTVFQMYKVRYTYSK